MPRSSRQRTVNKGQRWKEKLQILRMRSAKDIGDDEALSSQAMEGFCALDQGLHSLLGVLNDLGINIALRCRFRTDDRHSNLAPEVARDWRGSIQCGAILAKLQNLPDEGSEGDDASSPVLCAQPSRKNVCGRRIIQLELELWRDKFQVQSSLDMAENVELGV